MQGVQPNAQETLQAQLPPYSLPPAPTFASLGAHSMPFTGTLGSLAQGHQSQQPPAQSSQGHIPYTSDAEDGIPDTITWAPSIVASER